MRSTSGFGAGGQSTHSPQLVTRINEKKIELENLRELRDLSAQLAGQMEMLEEKLGTLANGTEGTRSCSLSFWQPLIITAVAAVLSNWHNVLRAIRMASSKQTRVRIRLTKAHSP
jgi:DASH complex subunit DAD2